jgi:hypothetical protein
MSANETGRLPPLMAKSSMAVTAYRPRVVSFMPQIVLFPTILVKNKPRWFQSAFPTRCFLGLGKNAAQDIEFHLIQSHPVIEALQVAA